MRDFLPHGKARRERVLGVIRETYRAHGFDEIETPVMEDAERLHAGLGGDNEKLAYAVLKRGLSTEDLHSAKDALDLADLGLRFDLTVPLARFYATHRAELPTVFRAIQIAPVWRAERPQKGRYRQFVQCDIDIIGEAGPLAEVELISATAAALRALGLEGCSIRVNDRRLLTSMLTVLGFPAESHESVLVTIDKLDKVGQDGVIAELREKSAAGAEGEAGEAGAEGEAGAAGAGAAFTGAVDALERFFRRPQTMEFLPFGEAAIRKALPEGVDETAVRELAAMGLAVEEAETARAVGEQRDPLIVFDPFLVRGMGYYTGSIFEIVHPSVGYSLGGGGRYDGMIGRFLGTDVPATGFSIGFERLVDLVTLDDATTADAVALVHDDDVPPARLAALKSGLIETGKRVRLERKARNMKPLFEQLAASGFSAFAYVSAESELATLEFRPLEQ
jgi:histidyl-tRNA synthetase